MFYRYFPVKGKQLTGCTVRPACHNHMKCSVRGANNNRNPSDWDKNIKIDAQILLFYPNLSDFSTTGKQ